MNDLSCEIRFSIRAHLCTGRGSGRVELYITQLVTRSFVDHV